MNGLRHILASLLTVAALLTAAADVPLRNETLNYNVFYKWGLIHKQAGSAVFNVARHDNHFYATVTAKSAKWADRFYHLRDTFHCKMSVIDLAPVSYERIAHEDGKYSRDQLLFKRSGNTFSATATRWRKGKKKNAEMRVATLNLKAEGMTVDLLTSFYYLRSLPFATMSPGTKKRVNIFSGKQKELLDFTYTGLSELKIDGVSHKTYKVIFTFTSDGRKETSDPIEAWISTDGRHIPLKLVGKLKIGQVQCIYAGD